MTDLASTARAALPAAPASRPAPETPAAPEEQQPAAEPLDYLRTEDGAAALITRRAALAEMNAGMLGDTKKAVKEMSAARTSATLLYRDGRRVSIRPATSEEIAKYTAPVKNTPAAEPADDAGASAGPVTGPAPAQR